MDPVWTISESRGPLVAAAIHEGSRVREEVRRLLAIDERQRRREEDPGTGAWTTIGDTAVVVHRSRFEVDLNRPRNAAVYVRPDQAWGLNVFKTPPPADVVRRSIEQYDGFYRTMWRVLDELRRRHGGFVVYDLHSYNHRRGGPDAAPADPAANPDINIGTATMDRQRWAPIVDRLIDDLKQFDFPGRRLDVRENVRFRGGFFPQWVHSAFPEAGCAVAIEVKKFYMDEWTGQADPQQVAAVRRALQATTAGVRQELEKRWMLHAS